MINGAKSPPPESDEAFVVLRERAEKNAAERDAALSALDSAIAALAWSLSYVRHVGGFMYPEHQVNLHIAQAALDAAKAKREELRR